MPLVYEDYAGRVESRSKLDHQLNPGVDKHLTEIARELVNLDTLTAKLGLKSHVLTDLEKRHLEGARQRLVAIVLLLKHCCMFLQV